AVHEFHELTGNEEVVLWKLECCNPNHNDFWSIMDAIFAWRNEATVDTTVSYFVYWIVVIIASVIIVIRGKKADKENIDTIEHSDSSKKDEKDAAENNVV
ncbi:19561_t:CDS:1, partial [Racocetra fulgida]